MWKKVKGFEDRYEISDTGLLRSLITGKLKIKQPDSGGYLKYCLYVNKKQYNRTIHRLVAEAFIKNPGNKKTVNHRDGNKHNNSVSNLEWMSLSENIRHSFEAGIKKSICGRGHWLSKETIQKSLDGKLVIKKWGSLSEASKENGYDRKSLWMCVMKKRKQAYGYVWEYA